MVHRLTPFKRGLMPRIDLCVLVKSEHALYQAQTCHLLVDPFSTASHLDMKILTFFLCTQYVRGFFSLKKGTKLLGILLACSLNQLT